MQETQMVVVKQLQIKGKVQGVWYRVSMQKQAVALGVMGWCRNTSNGDVEAVCVGPKTQVDTLMAWCHQGPDHARVDDIVVTAMLEVPAGITQTFEIRP